MIGLAGFAHLFLFGILVPVAAVRSKRFVDRLIYTPRRRYFVSVIAQVTILTLLSILTASRESVTIFPRHAPPLNALIAGVVMLAIAIAFGWHRWTEAVNERKPVIRMFMPLNAEERGFWVVCSALAGFGEEITWRGVQWALVTRLVGNAIVAAAICVVMFAVAHAIQGWSSAAVIAVFAAAFHLVVWLSGSLYVAMVVHFIYDLIAGFSYAYLARKLGYFEVRTSAADPAHSATQTI